MLGAKLCTSWPEILFFPGTSNECFVPPGESYPPLNLEAAWVLQLQKQETHVF